jgi:hypothetical protein
LGKFFLQHFTNLTVMHYRSCSKTGDYGMVRHIGRFLATAFIWAAGAGIIDLSTHGMNTFGTVVVVGLVLLFAFLTSRSIWYERVPLTDDVTRHEKRKRTTFSESPNKTDMLLALMDDNEREAFKEALKQRVLDSVSRLSDDGEIPVAFDDLLRDGNGERGKHLM